jgi:hypothetical protein
MLERDCIAFLSSPAFIPFGHEIASVSCNAICVARQPGSTGFAFSPVFKNQYKHYPKSKFTLKLKEYSRINVYEVA